MALQFLKVGFKLITNILKQLLKIQKAAKFEADYEAVQRLCDSQFKSLDSHHNQISLLLLYFRHENALK